MPIISYTGVVFPFVGSPSFWFLDNFEENANISVAIKSSSTVLKTFYGVVRPFHWGMKMLIFPRKDKNSITEPKTSVRISLHTLMPFYPDLPSFIIRKWKRPNRFCAGSLGVPARVAVRLSPLIWSRQSVARPCRIRCPFQRYPDTAEPASFLTVRTLHSTSSADQLFFNRNVRRWV